MFENTDQECFKWAIKCALYIPAKDPKEFLNIKISFQKLMKL